MLKRLVLRSSQFLALFIFVFFSQFSTVITLAATSDITPLQWPLYEPGSDCGNVSASSLNVTPGKGTPTGTTFPNLDPKAMASAIDKFIKDTRNNSPLEGLGSTIVASAKNSDISPFLIVPIALKESQLGTDGSALTKPPFNNLFGRTASQRQPGGSLPGNSHRFYKWVSVKASIDFTDKSNDADPADSGDMFSYLKNVYADALKAGDIDSFMNSYAPPSENDTTGYIQTVKETIQKLADLAQGGASAPATPASDSTPEAGTDPSCAQICADPSAPTDGSPTIVLDPGHAGANTSESDPATDVISNENTGAPGERKSMWDTAQDIKSKLEKKGYKVFLTKTSETDTAGLITKAQRASRLNAAIGVSLHYTGGERFGVVPTSHWGVTPQEVGQYRQNNDDSTKKKTFDDDAIAKKSQEYAEKIHEERDKVGDKNKITPLDQSFPASRGLGSNGNIPIIALFSKIPWVYNEAGAVGFNEAKYAEGIANGIMKAIPTSGTPKALGDLSPCAGTGITAAISTAIKYSWPTYHPAPYLTFKPEYREAIDKVDGKSYVGGGAYPGVDCGGFVTRVMQDSGADPKYNTLANNGYGGPTTEQQKYMDAHKELYENLGPRSSTTDKGGLKAGDIAINGSHTYMFVGHQSGFNGNSASASYLSWRTPMASSAYFSNGSGPFIWYRLKS